MSNPLTEAVLTGETARSARLAAGLSLEDVAKAHFIERDRLHTCEQNGGFSKDEAKELIEFFLLREVKPIWREAVCFFMNSNYLSTGKMAALMETSEPTVHNWRKGMVPRPKNMRFYHQLLTLYGLSRMQVEERLVGYVSAKTRYRRQKKKEAEQAELDRIMKEQEQEVTLEQLTKEERKKDQRSDPRVTHLNEPAEKPVKFFRHRHSGRGDYLRQLRYHMGLSMDQMGVLLSASKGTIYRWEKLKVRQPSDSVSLVKTIGRDYQRTGIVPRIKVAPEGKMEILSQDEIDAPLSATEADEGMPDGTIKFSRVAGVDFVPQDDIDAPPPLTGLPDPAVNPFPGLIQKVDDMIADLGARGVRPERTWGSDLMNLGIGLLIGGSLVWITLDLLK